MPKVVITHAVQEIDRWLQGKAERAAALESGTGSNVIDYVAQGEVTTSHLRRRCRHRRDDVDACRAAR